MMGHSTVPWTRMVPQYHSFHSTKLQPTSHDKPCPAHADAICLPAAAPTIGKYTLNDPFNASTTPEGEVILVPGLPPRDPITSFIYNDAKLGAEAATAECNKMCAHLASFRSQADQHDVEAYYIGTVSCAAGPEDARVTPRTDCTSRLSRWLGWWLWRLLWR